MNGNSSLLRHWQLLARIASADDGCTVYEMADALAVSTKTIRRDLALLKEAGFPVVETRSAHGRKHWRLETDAALPQLRFTIEEAAALYLGRQFLEPLVGTYFYDGARSAFQKIRATLGTAAQRHLDKLAAAFYAKSHGLSDYSGKGQLLDDLVRAIEDHRLTVLTYHSLSSTEPVTHYDVHPYAIVWHNRAVYLIAYSCDHKAIRTFKLDRISSVVVHDLSFPKPADFSAEKILAGSFGIFQGDGEPRPVRVRFSPQVARVVQERQQHPSQQLHPQPDGSLLAEYRLSSFEEFTSWILSFGEHAEVLEPMQLRDQVISRLRAASQLYEANKTRSPKEDIRQVSSRMRKHR